MLKVFKYSVPVSDEFSLDLPRGAQILKVDVQYGEVQLWALVDPDAKQQTRWFRFAGTEHPIEQNVAELKYISTFFMYESAMDFITRDGATTTQSQSAFHVFEILGKA